VLGCLPMLLLTFAAQRSGPEGPVGAHMVTGPLALLQATALAIAFANAAWAELGILRGWLYLILPGYLVASTALPILAIDVRWRSLIRAAIAAVVAGCVLTANAHTLPAGAGALGITGLALVCVHAGIGYAMLFALWVHAERNRMRAAQADVVQQSEFAIRQAEWQRGEWAKLPANAELWQLIQFTHAFAPEVKAQCLERIAQLPGLEKEMQALLGTGWAEHSLRYLEDHYPLRFGPLAAPCQALLIDQCARWEVTLRDDRNAGTWYYNLVHYITIAERIAADGGDVREGMRQWSLLLRGKHGLGELRARAERLATG
jgi:hypothetical protein